MIKRNDFDYGIQIEGTYSITQENGNTYINSGMIGGGLTFSSGILESTNSDFYFERLITSTEILNLGTAPIELVPAPGTNKLILPIGITAEMVYVTTPYATNGEIDIFCGGTVQCLALPPDNGFLFGTINRIVGTLPVNVTGVTDRQYFPDSPLELFMQGGNPTSGDSDIIIRGFYKIINL